MTPEQYFTKHPDVAVLAQQTDGFDFYLELPGLDLDEFRHTGIDIDWTGYSRRIAFNPHFAWGKRRNVVWIGKTTNFGVDKKDAPHRQLCNAEGEPLAIWEIGRYVDAPAVQDKPELSRFLPDGWGWKHGRAVDGIDALTVKQGVGHWHARGILHPSEGGGFQKHIPYSPIPCDSDLLVDYTIDVGGKYTGKAGEAFDMDEPHGVKAWRPHFEKGGIA